MIPLLLAALAPAQTPSIESTTAVQAVEWAQPVTLAEAAPYTMRADRPSFSAATVLQLKVEPGMARARAVDQPVLYVGGFPARVMNPSEGGTCLIAWAPTPQPLEQTRIYFGARTLPERVDADGARVQLEAAVQAGAPVFTPTTLEPGLQAATVDAIFETAQAAVARCK